MKKLQAVGLIDKLSSNDCPIPLPNRVQDDELTHHSFDCVPSRQEKGFVIVGSDVEKLFPSLKPLEAARLARIAILQSEVEVCQINAIMGLRYLLIVGGRELLERNKLIRLCPVWQGNREDLISLGGKKTNDDKFWRDTRKEITSMERKRITAAVIETAVIVTMNTHLYSFMGHTYIQLSGGPIGLRLTAALAGLVMAFFDKALDKLLEREKILTNLKFRYVDDGRLGLRPVRSGWRWCNGGVRYNPDWCEEDDLLGPQKRTTHLINGALNSLVEYLHFTTEDHLDYECHKLPTLDCQIWIECNKIMFDFYEKPQVPNTLLQATTALAKSSLHASLIQEGVRRLTNTYCAGQGRPTDQTDTILNKYAQKLVNSGFSQEETQSFLVHAATCYFHKVKRSKLPEEHRDYLPLFLSKGYDKSGRIISKTLAKTDWYITGRKNKTWKDWRSRVPRCWRERNIRQRNTEIAQVSTVIVVPNTEGSELLNRLVLKEAQLSRLTGYSVKLIEGNGTPLSKLFQIPSGEGSCHRGTQCNVCTWSDKKSSRCSVRSIVYTAVCREPRQETEQATEIPTFNDTCLQKIYIGESSRSLRERSSEHVSGGKRLETGNFITKHWLESHPELDRPPVVKFEVLKLHKDALSRQVDEALTIERANGRFEILNSKSEWSYGKISRLSVERSSWEIKKNANLLNEEEHLSKKKCQAFRNQKKEGMVSFDEALNKLKKVAGDVKVPSVRSRQDIRNFLIEQVVHKDAPVHQSIDGKCAPSEVVVSCDNKPCPYRQNSYVIVDLFEPSQPVKLDGNVNKFSSCVTDSEMEQLRAIKKRVLEGPAGAKINTPTLDTVHPKVGFGASPYLTGNSDRWRKWTQVFYESTDRMKPTFLNLAPHLKTTTKPSNSRESLLWEFRDKVGRNSGPDVFDHSGFYRLEEQDLTPLELYELFTEEFSNEYAGEIKTQTQDALVKQMLYLNLDKKASEDDYKKSLEHPLGRDIIKFLELLSAKLDQDCVPNLFRSNGLNPTSNLLASLLSHHKLRSTFDFEQATKRELKVDNSWDLRWSMSLLNEVGGRNTTSDAVFELKKLGNFRGLKRRQHTRLPGTPTNKLSRLDEICSRFEKVFITDAGSSPKLKLRVELDDKLGGVLTYDKDTCEPSHAVHMKRKPVKLSRTSPRKLITFQKKEASAVVEHSSLSRNVCSNTLGTASNTTLKPHCGVGSGNRSLLHYFSRIPRGSGVGRPSIDGTGGCGQISLVRKSIEIVPGDEQLSYRSTTDARSVQPNPPEQKELQD